MKKAYFFVISLVLATLVACGSGYGPETIKIEKNGIGCYVPKKGVVNEMCALRFIDKETAINEHFFTEAEAEKEDANAIYAMYTDMFLVPGSSDISCMIFARVIFSKAGTTLEVIEGMIMVDALQKPLPGEEMQLPCTLKCIVTNPKGTELKITGTINSVNKKISKKLDNTFVFTEKQPIMGF